MNNFKGRNGSTDYKTHFQHSKMLRMIIMCRAPLLFDDSIGGETLCMQYLVVLYVYILFLVLFIVMIIYLGSFGFIAFVLCLSDIVVICLKYVIFYVIVGCLCLGGAFPFFAYL